MNFRIHRLAVAEIDNEVDDYESRQSGLAFTIPYQFSGEETVILALAHTRRRPGYWSRRR
jgi:hypothetical protein